MTSTHILPKQRPISLNRHRPNLLPTSGIIMLTSSPNTNSNRCRNHNPNPMSNLRSNNPNNLTWPHLLNTILPSQHQLRTHT
uniref:Uncharacterized protein n=1 Tax=Cyanoderma ruficeps TaxID=181631 RepID=A0A8C3QZY6_9PASS